MRARTNRYTDVGGVLRSAAISRRHPATSGSRSGSLPSARTRRLRKASSCCALTSAAERRRSEGTRAVAGQIAGDLFRASAAGPPGPLARQRRRNRGRSGIRRPGRGRARAAVARVDHTARGGLDASATPLKGLADEPAHERVQRRREVPWVFHCRGKPIRDLATRLRGQPRCPPACRTTCAGPRSATSSARARPGGDEDGRLQDGGDLPPVRDRRRGDAAGGAEKLARAETVARVPPGRHDQRDWAQGRAQWPGRARTVYRK
jgi:hypothetical protein